MPNIYGLYDPRTPGVIMYVGKGSVRRAQSHWKVFLYKGIAVNALLRRRFEQLKVNDVKPAFRFLEEGIVDWQAAERKWIAHWRLINPALCNVADGGSPFSINAASLGGRASALWAKEHPKEAFKIRSEAGRIGGRLGSREGKAEGMRRRHELYPDWATEFGRKYGPKGGRRRIELHGNPATHESCVKGGLIGGLKANHQRWHVKRSKPNPECQLCRPEFFNLWEDRNA